MIEIEKLGKRFDKFTALDNFSLSVADGELFGLVGPNGAGKSTLMRILATLARPSAGRASVGGQDVTRDVRHTRALVGYMPDVPGLYQDMQVREFLAFFAEAFHLRAERKKVAIDRALQWSGLGDRASTYVEHLSLGLRQRLMLAKTLLHGPRLLLLDEPATGLDPLARIELREQLKRLQREGVTIFISSHILSDLEDICTRVAFIAQGHNASDADGHSVLALNKTEATMLRCLLETLEPAQAAVAVLAQIPGVHVLEVQEHSIELELADSPAQAAALLRQLILAGINVTRFDPRGPDLEARYRKVFGRKES